jgi:hypothetical protein
MLRRLLVGTLWSAVAAAADMHGTVVAVDPVCGVVSVEAPDGVHALRVFEETESRLDEESGAPVGALREGDRVRASFDGRVRLSVLRVESEE